MVSLDPKPAPLYVLVVELPPDLTRRHRSIHPIIARVVSDIKHFAGHPMSAVFPRACEIATEFLVARGRSASAIA